VAEAKLFDRGCPAQVVVYVHSGLTHFGIALVGQTVKLSG
jgi:hypothetical protein